ncbi:MAG TPA: MltA domain-containing protein [Nitrosomonas halophila]|nr:MltA domain-containing protein [Nitrosomonas halophila]
MKTQSTLLGLAILFGLSGCKTETAAPKPSIAEKPVVSTEAPPPSQYPPKKAPAIVHGKGLLQTSDWARLPDWQQTTLLPTWGTFLQGCQPLKQRPLWQEICARAAAIERPDELTIRRFMENHFIPYQVVNADGSTEGLATGYYEPLLYGSRKPSSRFRYPIYAPPEDLLTIDLDNPHADSKSTLARGRLEGRKVVPYYTRAEIENNRNLLKGRELLWVEDQVELFFLQIQGSGRIVLENGEIVKIGYADHNGYPYRSIGKLLIEQGELAAWQASMQGIKRWGQQNPDKLETLLQQNARFIFFRELPASLSGPVGALGVPLTAGRSLAIDPDSIPLGAPIYLATTWPNTSEPLNRLMVAQDTGSAIKGGVRADFFWGYGKEAETQAGKMKQPAKMWVLLPKKYRQQARKP